MRIRNLIHTRTSTVFGLAAIFLFVLASASLAADPPRVSVSAMKSQKLAVTMGKSVIVESSVPVKRVSVAAPEIADPVVLTTRQIYLTAKTLGVTTLTIWSEADRISAVFDVEVIPDVEALKEKIFQVYPGESSVKVFATNDGITLAGSVSSAENLTQIVRLAEIYAPLDKSTNKPKILSLLEVGGVHQVMLEVRVSEMSRSLLRRLGVNFSYISDGGQNFGVSLLKNLTTLPTGGWPGNPLQVGTSVNAIFRFLGGGASWTTFIDALKEEGLTKVLAEPTLITTNGRNAHFLAGGEYPIPVPQPGGGGTTITIDYKTFGIGLNFTPTVLSNNKISMEVNPEVSELDFTNALAISGYVVPSLTTRRVSTVIELADGQSFAIAGLMKEEMREIVTKFPVLGDIPILGVLFRSTSYQKNETELVIIVTPHLVKPVDMTKQTLPTDQFVEPNDFEFYLLGSMEGKGEPARPTRSVVPPGSGKSGLEGEFGHIAPK
jgi:pilus assembly protein CpaC